MTEQPLPSIQERTSNYTDKPPVIIGFGPKSERNPYKRATDTVKIGDNIEMKLGLPFSEGEKPGMSRLRYAERRVLDSSEQPMTVLAKEITLSSRQLLFGNRLLVTHLLDRYAEARQQAGKETS